MTRATWGSVGFFFLAPGTVAALVPWLISRWQADAEVPLLLEVAGFALVVAGLAFVIAAFSQFVREGRGTPAPVAPTERLVVGGLYRWVRNPMYLAVAAMIGGQGVILASRGILVWLVVFGVTVWSFVTFYEEPTLQRRYGASYTAYCSVVPGWWPRLTPYRENLEGTDEESRRS
jgi:protein-S-isoprenylcysteine O-methyltransferase Ste14